MAFRDDIRADLDAIYDDDGFAVNAVLRVQGVSSRPVRVIFDEPYQVANPVSGEAENTAPQCSIRTTEAAAASQGDSITVGTDEHGTGGTEYAIIEVQPGGSGQTVFILSTVNLHG